MKRETGKTFSETWFGAALVTLGLILLAQVFAAIADSIFPTGEKSGFPAAFRTYMADLWIWVIFIPMMLSYPADRKTVWKLVSRGQARPAAAGVLLGAGLIGLCYCAAWMTGALTPGYTGAPWWQLLLMLFAVGVQSGAEELAFRGFLLERCRRDLRKPWMAVALNALLFGALHLANGGVTVAGFAGTTAMGALLAVLYLCYESPWQVMLLHTCWNWLQNVILGLPNSGWVFSCSLLGVTGVTEASTFFYDPRFGLEGGWLCPLLAGVVIVFLILRNKEKFRRGSSPSKQRAPYLPGRVSSLEEVDTN